MLIKAISQLDKKGHDVICNIIGDGNLHDELLNKINELDIGHLINLHGNLVNPFYEISKADIFVLPSLSEGVSRSSMEALYLGIPCILRDIDGNSELVKNGVNGSLFSNENTLSEIMIAMAIESRTKKSYNSSLLPDNFRQSSSVAMIEKIIGINN